MASRAKEQQNGAGDDDGSAMTNSLRFRARTSSPSPASVAAAALNNETEIIKYLEARLKESKLKYGGDVQNVEGVVTNSTAMNSPRGGGGNGNANTNDGTKITSNASVLVIEDGLAVMRQRGEEAEAILKDIDGMLLEFQANGFRLVDEK